MSVTTDPPDHGGRNPYKGQTAPPDSPPSVAEGNGERTDDPRPPDPAGSDEVTAESDGLVAPERPASGENGHGKPDQPGSVEELPPPPPGAVPNTSPFIDLRMDGMAPPTSDPAAGLPAPPFLRGPDPTRPRRRPARRRAESPVEGRYVVHRLRNVSPWSVFKVVSLFYFCVFLMFMVAGVLLWNIARSTETVDQIEGLVTRLGAYGECVPEAELDPGTDFETDDDCPDGEVIIDGFRIDDGALFRSALLGGVIFVIAGTALTVLLTILLNLLNDVTGGIRYATVRESPPVRSTGR